MAALPSPLSSLQGAWKWQVLHVPFQNPAGVQHGLLSSVKLLHPAVEGNDALASEG